MISIMSIMEVMKYIYICKMTLFKVILGDRTTGAYRVTVSKNKK